MPGLEKLAAAELTALAAHGVQIMEGGVSFSGSMDALCRVNLRARCITRVLVRLKTFKALSFPELFNKSRKIHWQRYIPEDRVIQVRAACHHSKLMHSGRVEKAVLDAITEKLTHVGISISSADADDAQQVSVRLDHDQCVISIDSSGERLDRRGYRLLSGHAPIRETVAAGILQWMDWQADEALLVPMCGSGTFAIEAALMGQGRGPNLDHAFAFLHWSMLHTKRWKRVLGKATGMHNSVNLNIEASDSDKSILQQAIANAKKAGVQDAIHFEQLDVRQLKPAEQESGGLIVCNPPYGDRIKGDVIPLYKAIGRLLQDGFKGWRMAVIVPDQACENGLGHPVQRRLKIKHGGKWVHVLHLQAN